MQCVIQSGSSQNYFSARVVVYIITHPVWKSVPRPSSGQDGSVQSVKCARLAGKSNLWIIYTRTYDLCSLSFTV